MELRYIRTKDDLRLMGVHYISMKKDTLVLMTHGMTGNISTNYFAHVIGDKLSKNNIGFLYTHNRGQSYINDFHTSKLQKNSGYKAVRVGTTYEIFTDCLLDLDAWIEEAQKLGYKRIILMGHSLGCNKTIYYLSQRKVQNLVGVILASPPDLVSLVKLPRYEPDSEKLFTEARKNTKNGEPRKLLSQSVWSKFDDVLMSSQTFLSLFTEGTEVDNIPILRNPQNWSELSQITLPIFSCMGEYDDIEIRKLEDDLDLIAKKATSCSAFTKKMIPKASHTYDGQEDVIAQEILSWVTSL